MVDTSRQQFGPFLFDRKERVLQRGGETVPLTPKAFDLLAAFVAQPGRLLTKDELLKQVWPDTFVEESNLAYHVFVLRKALGDASVDGPYIETVPKRGYRFTATVAEVSSTSPAGPSDPVPASSDQPAIADKVAIPPLERSPRAPAFPVSVRLGVAALVLLPAILYLAAWRWREPPDSGPLQARPLTSLTGAVRSPSLSPDGQFVVFTWTPKGQGNTDIYVQQIGTTVPRPLTSDPGNDYSPAWSPDGVTIAFLRRTTGRNSEIWMVAPLGGPEKRVAELSPSLPAYAPSAISWCPNSRCLLVSDSLDQAHNPGVVVVDRDTGEKRRLTNPPGLAGDGDPIVSPDGQTLVFRRLTNPFSGNLYRLSLKDGLVPSGETVQVTTTHRAGKPAWIPGTTEVVFSSGGGLWRIDVMKGATPARLPFVGQDGHTPVVARTNEGPLRLIYERSFSDSNILGLDLAAAGTPAASPAVAAIASTRGDYVPALSPDGNRVAFVSNRSGAAEVWVADKDGARAEQLTSLAANPGYPRWSPDGKTLAVHGSLAERVEVVAVPAKGGSPQILTGSQPNGGWPSFSRDGLWLYFCLIQDPGKDRRARIWKMPATGGPAVQVTSDPGTLAIESYDRRDLYYVEASEVAGSPLWRVPVAGGPRVKVLDGVLYGQFDVTEQGIYFVDQASPEAGAFYTDRPAATRLRYFDIATKQISTVAGNLGWVGPGLSASRDGRTVLFTRIDSSINELMLVDGFR